MVLYLVPFAAAVIFIIAVVVRALKIRSLPIHLRWELYPVAHEKNARYGGSFFEQVDWWKKPRESSMAGELGVMIPEILLLKGVHEHNRSLWWRSFPFHFGLYMLAGFVALLLAGALAMAGNVEVGSAAHGFGLVLHWLTLIAGVGGCALLALGSLALLLRRLSDPVLREYSAPADFLNLVLFLAAAVVALAAWATADRDFFWLRGFFYGVVTFHFESGVPFPPLVVAEIVLGSVLIAYIPLTHMSHFFTKYFMWHDIRWDDKVNDKGGKMDARIKELLGQKVSWSAPHIRGEGKKSWLDVATEEVTKK
ncbi:MAG: respiratory nitrate reductase subunit gamma [Deltaproteobacteria bacterium]|nr:respiratory nitrate reductase subunit gamma [Deltaproteobacteria bacterium]